MSRKAASAIINSNYGERKEFSINPVPPPVFDIGRDVRITNTMPIFFSRLPSPEPLRIGIEIVVRETLKRNGKSFILSHSLLKYTTREWRRGMGKKVK
ncbi:hypothetical protein CEXT_730501 [Caerostris extrusa]|uniref:Uncharacterized protein n=1 Tax=Caerostris extrusa TaxID=172846 RepID=A0AAV4NFI0_CAEEX|nr:hypothetical protein CEXT_730501 [Caerostris extrusa]